MIRHGGHGSRSSRRGHPLGLALGMALAAVVEPALLYGLYLLLGSRPIPHEPRRVTFTRVSLVSPDTVERLRTKPERKKEREEVRKEEELRGQVVDIPEPKDTTPPRDARFLARWNSSVKRQTRKFGKPGAEAEAREATRVERARPAGQRRAKLARAEIRPPSRSPPKQASPPSRLEAARRAQRRLRLLDEGTLKLEPGPDEARREPRPDAREGASAEPGSYQDLLPPLVPSSSQPGNRGSDDYLPDLPEGDELALNARQFKYWSFFQRVREYLRQNWHAARKYRMRDPWGKIYGVKDRMTVLRVTLDRQGNLHDLHIVKRSGVDFLDDEAMMAFRRVGSFPNPPPGLVDPDGYIRFNFGFVLTHDLGLKLFRFNY